MPDNTGPPHPCGHAALAQHIVDSAQRVKRVTPRDIIGGTDIFDDLLRKLRMGRSRRNRYGDLRKRLRQLRALCKAAERFWGPPTGCFGQPVIPSKRAT